MSDTLVFMGRQQKSKATRFFRLFKPSECIKGEPFDLHLTFKNDSDAEYTGGECSFGIDSATFHTDFSIDLPPIKPHEDKTVTIPDITVGMTGFVALSRLAVRTKDGKEVSIKGASGRSINSSTAYPLSFVTREELYQKYSVIVALVFNIFAAILTIVNVLISIFR